MTKQHARAGLVLSRPWAMERRAFIEFANRVVRIEREAPADFFVVDVPAAESDLEVEAGVARIPVRGVLYRESDRWSRYFGETPYDVIAEQLDEAIARKDVRSIVLDIDSPGGDALGLAELSDRIYKARGEKRIEAAVRGLGASAAYFIASACSAVYVARESIVGSIGTIMVVVDWSKFDERIGIQEIHIVSTQSPRKDPDPTTDAGRQQLQEEVDAIAEVFVTSVARNRGVSRDVVLSDFGGGWVLVGEAAVAAGLADGVASLDDVLSARRGGRPVQFLRPLVAA